MKKSILMGGVARIIREPSRQNMMDAMLRRMGAGHILDGEGASKDAPGGDTTIGSREQTRG